MRRDRLTRAIATAIDHSMKAAEYGCLGQPGEVDRLVYFFLEGLPAIESQFNGILADSRVRATLSGIFCHQTPHVNPIPPSRTTPPGCELGDILFLVTYGRRLRGDYLGNALLVQAKEEVESVDGTTQAHLYERAIAFDYTSPQQLARQQRDLTACQFALWYWGFGRRAWRSRHWWRTEGRLAARPRMAVPRGEPFEDVLMDLICGVNGRRVKSQPANSTETGWSKIVDDLIRVTARSALTRQNAFISRDKEVIRGEDFIRVLAAMLNRPGAPFLARCSLDRIFHFFDDELAKLGKELTEKSKAFDADRFFRENQMPEKEPSGDAPPPTLGNQRIEVDGQNEGGCSFVIINFEG